MNYAQIKAIEYKNKQRILAVAGNVPERSGIYIFTREENGFKFAYVGQALHLLTRLAQHLTGYQHIDLSIKKHGLYSKDNPCGYKIHFYEVDVDKLDETEQYEILRMASKGYQLRNKTIGGQGMGKTGLDNAKEPKGYRSGLEQGYKNARRDVAKMMKHLEVHTKSMTVKKRETAALEKFKAFIEVEENE